MLAELTEYQKKKKRPSHILSCFTFICLYCCSACTSGSYLYRNIPSNFRTLRASYDCLQSYRCAQLDSNVNIVVGHSSFIIILTYCWHFVSWIQIFLTREQIGDCIDIIANHYRVRHCLITFISHLFWSTFLIQMNVGIIVVKAVAVFISGTHSP